MASATYTSSAGSALVSGQATSSLPQAELLRNALATQHIHNMVSSLNLGSKPDLKEVALRIKDSEYSPERFSACILRSATPKATALLFKSGKMVITGVKTDNDAKAAARKRRILFYNCILSNKIEEAFITCNRFGELVNKHTGLSVKIRDFKVQNIIGSFNSKFNISLEKLSYDHGKFTTYEPELFPGVVYRMKSPKVVILIFVNGKVVITGAKSIEEINQAFTRIFPVLYEHRKIN